ncbi:hypothetical protein [Solemya velesiana gill symbiont]|uniref:HMA domain-containing protein n=1 Tax=Solemya velesiana gill symbiont TaxID=1918948 RepID=A0A1T2KY96_9GAMM|nr:hypothetical protein [Solemya velesiana gill symbiont]OOZ37781.1 hypothetical protein BOW51_00505 [Solemya velesiana gill symbiont]
MDNQASDSIKQREIVFVEMHPDPNQAQTAAEHLSQIDGILDAHAESPTQLRIRYHVLEITLEQIESALTEAGFHISSRLIHKLRRALFYYTEEIQRANNGCPQGESKCTRQIFINRYQQINHSCRDGRPGHWRKYQ